MRKLAHGYRDFFPNDLVPRQFLAQDVAARGKQLANGILQVFARFFDCFALRVGARKLLDIGSVSAALARGDFLEYGCERQFHTSPQRKLYLSLCSRTRFTLSSSKPIRLRMCSRRARMRSMSGSDLRRRAVLRSLRHCSTMPEKSGPELGDLLAIVDINSLATLIILRALGFFYLFNQRRHDVKQIPDHAKIRDFKDRRFRIFVHRDDSSRALHADNVLNRTADSQRQV
jgi:hypothetical protein